MYESLSQKRPIRCSGNSWPCRVATKGPIACQLPSLVARAVHLNELMYIELQETARCCQNTPKMANAAVGQITYLFILRFHGNGGKGAVVRHRLHLEEKGFRDLLIHRRSKQKGISTESDKGSTSGNS